MNTNKCQYDAECQEPAYRCHILDLKGWLCETHREQGGFKRIKGEPEDYFKPWTESVDGPLPKMVTPLYLSVYTEKGSELNKKLVDLQKEYQAAQ